MKKPRGSVEKRGEKFRARVHRVEKGLQTIGTFDTQVEAEGALAAAIRQLPEMVIPDVTLAKHAEGWLDGRERTKRNTKKDRSVWRRHVGRTAIAALGLRAIGQAELCAWIAGLETSKACSAIKTREGATHRQTDRVIARGTARQAWNLLRSCLDDAASPSKKLIPSNPARDHVVLQEMVKALVSLKRPATDEDWTYLTEDEIEAVLTCPAIPEWKRLAFGVAIYAGLRQGELWGLQWSNLKLDVECPEITVAWSYRGPTKAGVSKTVPLLPHAVELLKRWKKASSSTSAYVFPGSTKGPFSKGYDAGWADKPQTRKGKVVVVPGMKTKAGITRAVRFHDLRHTFASHLVMGTWGRAWRLEEVQYVMRHASIEETQIYAHLAPDGIRRAAKDTHLGSGNFPRLSQDTDWSDQSPQIGQRSSRATRDSNARPSVPETDALSN